MLLMINGIVVWSSRLQIMANTLNISLKTFDNFSDNFVVLISTTRCI